MQTIEITLGGDKYRVPRFNLGQHKQLAAIFKGDPAEASFSVLGLALARATPAVDDVMMLDATMGDIKTAVENILEFSGYRAEAAAPNG
jgi:hypothetical protein